jgi:anti-sigma-K factor RskA
MHREIRDRLEEVLDRPDPHGHAAGQHLETCIECRDEIAAMREQAAALRELRAEVEPRPGFYARVMERIDASRAVSIWTLFFESAFGRRLAVASMALALLLGVYLVTSERALEEQPTTAQEASFVPGEDQPAAMLTGTSVDRDAVLVNLVTYREQ